MSRILYTLCGADRKNRFSPHAFKAFMALHHKGLDFTEVPTPFTEIPAIENGFSATVPVLNDNGLLVRDSFDIALYLDRTYPEKPSLIGGAAAAALTRAIEGYVQTVVQAALARIVVKDIHDMLAPVDQTYFRTSREKRHGRTLEDVHANREPEIAAFPAKLETLRHTLRLQPWLGGDTPMFADYIAGGAFAWARAVSPVVLLPDDDVVAVWFNRLLDLYDDAGRSWPASHPVA